MADRNRDLARLMGHWLDNPLACTERYATIAAAVFSGRMKIETVMSQFGELGRGELEAIAGQAKVDADAKRADTVRGTILEAVDNIAVIQVYGALTRTWGIGPYSGSTGYDGILMQLEDALGNPDIKGVWLDIDSGGGTINGLFDLADMIYSFRKSQGGPKPIWGMAADYAYSAAYMLGCACDRFYMPPSGGVGSIGVITMHASYRRQLEDDGVDVTVMRFPAKKALGTEYEDLDKDTLERIMGQLRYLGGMFQERVARNMGIAKAKVVATEGLDYTAPDAKAIGLVSDIAPEPVVWENFKRLTSRR